MYSEDILLVVVKTATDDGAQTRSEHDGHPEVAP